MKLKFVFISLFLIYSFTSCKKEIITPTSADQITSELQKVIKDNGLDKVYPVRSSSGFPNEFPADAGGSWTFSNGFIQINGYLFNQSLNLNYLSNYAVLQVGLDNGTSVKALILYFDF